MRHTKYHFSLLLILVLSTHFGIQSGHAEDLAGIYPLASRNDPAIREARAQYQANHTFVGEGLAQLLPALTLSGNSARNTFAPTVLHDLDNGFNTHNYNLNLSQNLLNFEAWYNFQSLRQRDRQALTTLAMAEQEQEGVEIGTRKIVALVLAQPTL